MTTAHTATGQRAPVSFRSAPPMTDRKERILVVEDDPKTGEGANNG